MKIKIGVMFLMLIFVFQFVSAVQVEMKESFDQGETLIAKVSGNFLDLITEDNVFLYRRHVRVPMVFDIFQIEGDYYIYALLDKSSENYSLVLEGVRYMVGIDESEEDVYTNFTISEETAYFSVNPGVIFIDKDFYLEVQNLQEVPVEIDYSVSGGSLNNEVVDSEEEGFFGSLFGNDDDDEFVEEEVNDNQGSIELKSGEKRKIEFDYGKMNFDVFQNIILSSGNTNYEIPAYIFGEPPKDEKVFSLDFYPSSLEVLIPEDTEFVEIIDLTNEGDFDIYNISLSISESLESYFFVSIKEIEVLEVNETIEIEIKFLSEDEFGFYYGELVAESENVSIKMDLSLEIGADAIEVSGRDDSGSLLETCAEKEGVICDYSKEKCVDGEIETLRDGNCCYGKCEKEDSGLRLKIIGWGIVGLVVLFVIWFFLSKFRNVRRGFNLLNVARGRK